MKTADQRHNERPDMFAPDGYELLDSPGEVAESMEAARYAYPVSENLMTRSGLSSSPNDPD
ncbi:MAG: hypothetical protein A3J97_05570 [Spirochaetes bacterium RIFOXYC1_FULL_54_7]|nr:MAG: hypothetical protein A3J97_05570 [Spirochaetes bacterium RIFOXYC1_FULL_54_7]